VGKVGSVVGVVGTVVVGTVVVGTVVAGTVVVGEPGTVLVGVSGMVTVEPTVQLLLFTRQVEGVA
jgi:hypothetical protein